MSLKTTLIVDVGYDTIKYGLNIEAKNIPQHVINTGVLDNDCISMSSAACCCVRNPQYKTLDLSSVVQMGLNLYPCLDPRDSNLLICQPYDRHIENKSLLSEIVFEQFSFSGIYMGLTNVMSLYSCGLLSGGVLESGASSTNFIPIYDGTPLSQHIERSKITGDFLNYALQYFLFQNGKPLNNLSMLKFVKENACVVSDRLYEAMVERKEDVFQLPDGRVIGLSKEGRKCPEVCFCPSLGLVDTKNFPRMVVDSLESIAKEFQDNRLQILMKNIILSGGNTMFPNFNKRFENDLKVSTSANDLTQISVYPLPNPMYSPWHGGAILANTTAFESNMVCRQKEFAEQKEN